MEHRRKESGASGGPQHGGIEECQDAGANGVRQWVLEMRRPSPGPVKNHSPVEGRRTMTASSMHRFSVICERAAPISVASW